MFVLTDWKSVRWQNRAHFFGVAAQMMRRILVDFARQRPRVAKDVDAMQISLDEAMTISTERDPDGTRFVFISEGKAYLADIKSKRAHEIFKLENEQIGGLGISTDGQLLYFIVSSSENDIWLLDLQ